MSPDTALLTEIRDLLRVIAEPALAKRDEGLRESLIKIVGKSSVKANAVLLMDGSRNQSLIVKESGIDQGNLSRMSKSLRDASLISALENPKLVITIPPNFFENSVKDNG